MLKTMNYFVTVIDHRELIIDAFSGADRKELMGFSEYLDKEGLKEDSYVIVCTPSHEYDYNVLHKVISLGLKPKYIGMLCSPLKLQDYLEKTYEAFGSHVDLTNFYSPIGLDIGGQSPEEIAKSITAEILAVQNGKAGHKHMRLIKEQP